MLGVVAALLDLADSRVTISQVIDLAATGPVRRRFGLDDDALERLREWTAAAGARWGIGIRERRAFGLDGFEQNTIKAALDRFVFAANDGNTWVSVTSMVSGFLQGLWSQGGLMGATAQEAFSVECGLGSTMTGQDVLEGYMIVQVTLQMIRPAEFIELTFKQKMEGVA